MTGLARESKPELEPESVAQTRRAILALRAFSVMRTGARSRHTRTNQLSDLKTQMYYPGSTPRLPVALTMIWPHLFSYPGWRSRVWFRNLRFRYSIEKQLGCCWKRKPPSPDFDRAPREPDTLCQSAGRDRKAGHLSHGS